MILVVSPEHQNRLHWLRLLPHLRLGDSKIRGLAEDADSREEMFEYLFRELSRRKQEKEHKTHLLIFLYDDYGFRNHPVSRFVEQAADLGVTFIVMSQDRSGILPECKQMIDLVDAKSAFLVSAADINDSCYFRYFSVNDREAEAAVRMLAPVFTEELSLEQELPDHYTLFSMLNIQEVSEIDLLRRWQKSEVYRSMAVPIGKARKKTVYLDLHESEHGPHGLVAGTTGSGKSELLLTYILAAAVTFHPYEVRFLIIDFKGGGMVNQIRDLPHLAGAITNIDGKETSRSLRFLRTELWKREKLFDAAGVTHIDTYIQRYREGKLEVPLPHLIIVVDEFAELRAEQPEFMKELISAARVGRSLGVHLILATQKPSGQVSEQIWSNSRFHICLRVQDAGDSNEVLKSPLAAEIRRTGRAYLQVGNNEIFELFQSAYCKSPAAEAADCRKAFSVSRVSDTGKKTLLYSTDTRNGTGSSGKSQMEAVLEHIREVCDEQGIQKLPDVLRPALPECLEMSDLKTAELLTEKNAFRVSIGIYDDPDHQEQPEYSVDLSSGNLLALGAPQSGKTNLLQTIIKRTVTANSPEEVQIYIIDFASMALKPFEKLPHVGGVVSMSEEEKLMRLMYLLEQETERRKRLLGELGVSSIRSCREQNHPNLPYILLLIDNLNALKELYFQEDERLLRLLREGQYTGICAAAVTGQITGLGYRYLACFRERIALNCLDSGEYNMLFEHCRIRPDPVPGRALVEIERSIYECQIFQAFAGEKEQKRKEKATMWMDEICRSYPGSNARQIPVIPPYLSEETMLKSVAKIRGTPFSLVLGLNNISAAPVSEILSKAGVMYLTGREENAGRDWLHFLLAQACCRFQGQCALYLMDTTGRNLADLKDRPEVRGYSTSPEQASRFVLEMEEILKNREEASAGEEPLLILVLDQFEAVREICSEAAALKAYRNITGIYRNRNVCVLIRCDENHLVSFHAPEILRDLRETGKCLYFGEVRNLRIPDVPVSAIKALHTPRGSGDAFYIRGGDFYDLKVPVRKRTKQQDG